MPVKSEPDVIIDKIRIPLGVGGGGKTGGDDGRGDGGGGGGGDRGRGRPDDEPDARLAMARSAMWVALAPIVMFFAAFCSAYIVRRGMMGNWVPLQVPLVVWLSTLLLLASSATLERSRGFLRTGVFNEFGRWWRTTTLLGLAFLVGQVIAWWLLMSQGVYLAANPSGSFFYLLTASHALHLLGGVAGLLYVARRERRGQLARRSALVDVTSIYWHFMAVVWVVLFLMLVILR
jgi:cytochrome c oxidase subunit III